MARKRIAIVQSSYIPWKGYFDLIRSVDEFVLYDEVQFTRRDWRNRNRIKTPQGLLWLSVPVQSKGQFHAPISSIEVSSHDWPAKHWRSIVCHYGRAPFFPLVAARLEELFLGCTERRLSLVNHHFLSGLCSMLGVTTRLSWASDYRLQEGKSERLVDICRQAGATEYLSGPSAAAYLDENQFRAAGIAVKYADYSAYPVYPQLHGAFEHQVSVIDLLMNVGLDAPQYMLSF